ncbi:MAG: translation elongation factor Ts [Proteobacteria bacterium]|nr:translation elongation factor Ts [Pseudomonadota bacterium]MCL2307622.1 translation elongation factor Ts [Pseudomonadota bacterium]
MAEISASVVMELRQRTGLGMMECKKALLETQGDLEKAEDLLRIKSGAKASKAAGRIAAEGTVGGFVAADGKTAALVEVNCETDFVARSEDFLKFAKDLAELTAAKNPADVEVLSALSFKSGEYEGTVETVRQALVQKIGENVSVRRFARRTTAARLVQYLHGGGRIGVTVEVDGDEVTGKDIALHVAASVAGTRPLCIAKEQVPAELVNKEREIFTAQAAESGKPAEIVAKMVEGRVAKYLAEVTLLGQPFVKNPDETVEQYLKGKKASVKAFDLLVVGEGIEKKKDDFAAEVAAMTKG